MAPVVAALLLSLASSAAPRSAEAPTTLAALVERARADRLASQPGWLRLGHWRPRLLGGFESEVDGKEFFLARNGKRDPAAELEATLAGFLDEAPHAEELDAARCRFPARLAFLSARLGIDPALLPPRPCPKLEAFLERVRPRGVTLVFSSYYLNNPASAFGHTLLRLDRTGQARAGKDAELLDYGVDFSATVTTSNALLYAFQGLFGLFHGEFKHYAYYYKVRQYGDYESRDLFEYELALDPAEVALLTAHIWELGGTWFRYWYLDENCSYQVLTALEAAAPRLELVRHVGRAVVLPSDTVQALFYNPGLVRAVHHRPSIRTQFQARARGLLAGEPSLVEELERDPAAPIPGHLPPGRRAAVLDAAVDLLDLRHARGLLVGADPEAAARRQLLLARRAAIPVPSPALQIPNPVQRRPEGGHRSLRLGAGGGAGRAAGGFASLDLRLALHDLLDPPDGYPPSAQIEFLPVRLRFYPATRRLELDDASLVRVYSVNPMGRFDLRPSWRMRAGATTVRDGGCHRCLAGSLDLGAGPGVADVLGVMDLLAFGDAELLLSGPLRGIRDAGVRLGLGPSGLVRLHAGTAVTFLAEARWRWFPEATPRSAWTLSAALRVHPGRNLSVGLEARRTPSDDEVGATVFGYF
jgi:hypothetical protein